jgi:hypothetical protein
MRIVTYKNRTSTSNCPTYPMRTPMDSMWIPKFALVNGYLIGRGRTRHRRVVPFPLCSKGIRNQVNQWVDYGASNRRSRRFKLVEEMNGMNEPCSQIDAGPRAKTCNKHALNHQAQDRWLSYRYHKLCLLYERWKAINNGAHSESNNNKECV